MIRVNRRLQTADGRLQTTGDSDLQTTKRRLWIRSKIQTKGKMQTHTDHE